MKDYQLAWKNLWRNRRRTLITATSVFFAVFFALVMRAFQLGTYEKLYKDVIESYTGYLQLQEAGYFDEPGLDNSFEVDPELLMELEKDPNVTAVVPRLESFALAAVESRTQGVMVLGMDPEGEDKALNIRNRMVRYKLTPEAAEAIKKEGVPQRTEKLLDVFLNQSYTDEFASDYRPRHKQYRYCHRYASNAQACFLQEWLPDCRRYEQCHHRQRAVCLPESRRGRYDHADGPGLPRNVGGRHLYGKGCG